MLNSLAAALAALLLPSRSTHVTLGRLALINMLVTAFFLFTAGYHFPGGAMHYPNWAEAIVHGTTLPPDVAQREVGLPLLYILGGFPFWHSFIGITLIFAAFGVLMPVLVGWSLMRTSPTIAFYTGLACIISLSSVTYLKFFYPDQAHMFFNLLAAALLIEFLWCKRVPILYLFTLAAIAASFMRTAGNLLFPVLLTIAYITVRGRPRHYLGCVLIFALAAGLYQWHRYEVFDVHNQPSIPSGKGMQMFYTTYLYLGDFGYRFSPDIGPNSRVLLEKLQQELQPNVREASIVKRALSDDPAEFMEKHVYAYTPQELFEKICTEPNEEYWAILMAVEPYDQFYLNVAKEIAVSHPWYIVQYSMRNLWHSVFDPGYATTRYNTQGYIKTGNDFVPGTQGWGVRSEDPVEQYGPRAAREMEYFPLKSSSAIVQKVFAWIELHWLKYYGKYVWVTSALIMAAWIGAFLSVICWVLPHTSLCRAMVSAGLNKLGPPVIITSALLLYEDLATAMFSQPLYRYFHMTEPLRLVIAGFGVAFLVGAVSLILRPRITAITARIAARKHQDVISAIQRHDLLDQYFGPRRVQWILFLLVVNACLFAWWTFSMIAHTSPAPPV